jgi:hypothetical protein
VRADFRWLARPGRWKWVRFVAGVVGGGWGGRGRERIGFVLHVNWRVGQIGFIRLRRLPGPGGTAQVLSPDRRAGRIGFVLLRPVADLRLRLGSFCRLAGGRGAIAQVVPLAGGLGSFGCVRLRAGR